MTNVNDFPKGQKRRISLLVILGAVVLGTLLLWSSITVKISSGEGGVLYRLLGGGVDLEKTYPEGFHFKLPWDQIFIYELRQQEMSESMEVLSSNGLEIIVDVSAWFNPNYNKLPSLHKKKGPDYVNKVVKPALRSATRSVIGRYTPEEIYSSKRDSIQIEIFSETHEILETEFVNLNRILVRDVNLPEKIKAAIESKLQQEQENLAYEFRIIKEKNEAERIRINAEGKAAANRILNASLSTNILKEKGIQATMELAKSQNAKVVVIGSGKDGMPLILGNN